MTNPKVSMNTEQYWRNYAAKASDELAEQVAIFGWAALPVIRERYPDLEYLFAVPNGMWSHNKAIAGKYRAAGIKSGVPDMLLPVKRSIYSGLFIELKPARDKGKKRKADDNQERWIAYLQSQKFGATVCYGFEETITMLKTYLDYHHQPGRDWATKEQDMQMFDNGG